ncbi:MAG: trypsin-like peptidase domain-containing protein [Planctomycetaceae bacterium]|nr:trypsin-like peptidase domain-containing protein [Planctomycetaceae bacterium]
MALALAIVPQTHAANEAPSQMESHRESQLTRVIAEALRASVNIHTEKRQKSIDVVFSAGKATKINGMGTGIVIDERGYVVTNYHVVQDVERLRVTTYNGEEYEARVLAYDSREDLAIIKIDPMRLLDVADFGTSSDLMLGEDVVAIGNAYGYESTVTRGIISHRSRDVEVNEEQAYENLIQIDAAINPGNSGGPLINADGEVIGINVAIRAGAQRIGFAIPIDDARRTISRLLNIERHFQTTHGIVSNDVKAGQERKLVVQTARPGSPAAAAGFREGDIILRAADVKTVDGADLERSLIGIQPGETIPVIVLRNGEEIELDMTLSRVGGGRINPGQQNLASTAPAPQPGPVPSQKSLEDRSWEVLGMKLAKIDSMDPLSGQPYRGGMQVVKVRDQSPADTNGIREGDILVGLHIWETICDENIEYVLNRPELSTIGPLRFYIVRDGETLFGHFRVLLSQR